MWSPVHSIFECAELERILLRWIAAGQSEAVVVVNDDEMILDRFAAADAFCEIIEPPFRLMEPRNHFALDSIVSPS